MVITDQELPEVMEALGLVREDFLCVKEARNLMEAQENLKLLKDKAKKGFRKAAIRLHPDVNGGDEKKTEMFKKVMELSKHIEKLKIQPRPPAPRIPLEVLMRMHRPQVVWVQSTSTSSTTATTEGWPGTTNIYSVRFT